MLDTTMVLRDGRTLAYTEIGDADGPLVMYFHGAPTSRLDLVALEEDFASAGVRVVSPDRPGYGGSSAITQRSLADWPEDVAALADHLERDRFALMGLSSGGPYVVASAAGLADRVVGACVIAGCTDMSWAPAWDSFPEWEAAIMRLGDLDASIRWCTEHLGADGSGFLNEDIRWSEPDAQFLSSPVFGDGFILSIVEAFRQGVHGFAQDITVQAQPWKLDLGAIVAPVRVLHGEADSLLSVAHSEHTAALIPQASLEVLQGYGHLSILTQTPRLARDLALPLAI
jgi:pimeloyl-ACP methyl ester carboxylesterase